MRIGRRRATTSTRILEELGLAGENRKPTIEVWNKIDALDPERREGLRLAARREEGAAPVALVSALTGEGLEPLLEQVERLLAEGRVTRDIVLEAADGEGLAWAYAHAEVLHRVALPDGGVRLLLRAAPERIGELDRRFPPPPPSNEEGRAPARKTAGR